MFSLKKLLKIILGIDDDEELKIEYYAKLLAVAVYTDYKYVKEEVDEVHVILQREFESKKDIKRVETLIKKAIALYIDKEYKFNQDKKFIITNILKNNLWEDAQYLIRVFNSDGNISDTEREISKLLSDIIQSRKFLMQKLELYSP